MTTARAGVKSDPPTVKIAPYVKENPLKAVYERCYETPEYRKFSPGEHLTGKFWKWANPFKTQTVIDWGCGTGRAGLDLHKKGMNVTLVDFTPNSLDPHVEKELNDNLRFQQLDITKPLTEDDIKPSHFGFCCDVLEHIPEEDIDVTIRNILSLSRHVFFQISTVKDHFGGHDHIRGEEDHIDLHLTVHNYSWWLKKFADLGLVIHNSADRNTNCIFYLTHWRSVHFDPLMGTVNVSKDDRIANIRHAATLDIPSVTPHEAQDTEIMLLAGGPTLSTFEDEIIQNRKDGMKLITVNGTYNWAIARGLSPSLQFLIDSRGFNKRFVEQDELSNETKFIVSSTADPEVFEKVPVDRTYIVHTTLEPEIMKIVEEEYGPLYEKVFPIPGGCTVTLRALACLRMLGFYKIHLYGFDSCLMGKSHHAYAQEENDHEVERAFDITIAEGSAYEKTFSCVPWMAYQALDFQNMVPRLLKDVQLDIKGEGMIAYMVQVSSELGDADLIDVEIDDEPRGGLVYKLKDNLN